MLSVKKLSRKQYRYKEIIKRVSITSHKGNLNSHDANWMFFWAFIIVTFYYPVWIDVQ